MKRIFSIFCAAFFAIAADAASYSIYVDFINGNDSWNGTVAAFTSGSNGPYKNLSTALTDAAAKTPTTNSVTIYLQGSARRTTKTFFTSAHSGASGNPLQIKAYGQGTVSFSSNYSVPGSAAAIVTSGDARWSQVPASARGVLRVIDLTAAGVPATTITRRAWSINEQTASEIIPSWNGARLQKARFPKGPAIPTDFSGDDYSSTLSQTARRGVVGYSSINTAGTSAAGTVGGTGPSFTVSSTIGTRAAGWVLGDVWLNGQLAEAWETTANKVAAVASNVVTLTYAEQSNLHAGSFANSFFCENILEECTTPGEYYFDQAANKFYFYPLVGWTTSDSIDFAGLDRLIDAGTNCNYVSWDGITFEGSTGNTVHLNTCSNWTFTNCKFRNSGLANIYSTGGSAITIDSCDISGWSGPTQGGVWITNSGTGSTLTGGGCSIVNNYIHDGGYTLPASAIKIDGVGHTIKANTFANLPSKAIDLGGVNNVTITGNRFTNVITWLNDFAAIYSSTNNVMLRGNTITGNYFTDIGTYLPGQCAIYFDNITSGYQVWYNTFTRVANAPGHNYGAIYANGGNYLDIQYNVFVECPISMNFSSYALQSLGATHIPTLSTGTWYTTLSTAIGASDARVAAYPELASLATFFNASNWQNSGSGYFYALTSKFQNNVIVLGHTPKRGLAVSSNLTWSTNGLTYDSCTVAGTPSLQVSGNTK